jgi:hemoglobin-like flavoprotein|tara:strand:+ start:182 stop:376 length:195 start_codon:yes stop_codon:yes gene_type:complete
MKEQAEKIANDIVNLADSLDNAHDLDNAWRKITQALHYLSAKDSMYKTKQEIEDAKKKERESSS